VLTRDTGWAAHGAEPVHSLAQALDTAGDGPVAVIGGAEIFREFMPYAQWIELTEIAADYPGDTVMPPLDPCEWTETAREQHDAAGDFPAYTFRTLKRAA